MHSRRSSGLLVIAAGLLAMGCDQKPATPAAKKADPPSKVDKIPGEADLTTIHLKPEAEERLGLATAKVERKAVGRVRVYGGEVLVPPGKIVIVSSPLVGTILAPKSGEPPKPGDRVRKGQEVVRLLPLLSPEARATLAQTRVEADGQVDQAQKQMAQAKITLDRAERLRRDQLGGSGALEDAKAQLQIAESAYNAAVARREALDRTIKGVEGGTLEPLPLTADADGIVKNVQVMPGQPVSAGAVLFDIEALDPVWVRVPVYVGEKRRLDVGREVRVGEIAGPAETPTRPGRPVKAPPSGDPLAATVHLFYEVENRDDALWPGQRVGVTVPLVGEAEGLVVPRSALLYDIQGGTWVYRKAGDQTYRRTRVRLDHIDGDLAVLSDGPEAGAEVIVTGAAELFGTEFGGAK